MEYKVGVIKRDVAIVKIQDINELRELSSNLGWSNGVYCELLEQARNEKNISKVCELTRNLKRLQKEINSLSEQLTSKLISMGLA